MSVSLAVIKFLIRDPIHSFLAAMIETVTGMNPSRGPDTREYLYKLQARKDVKKGFVAQYVIFFVILQKEKHQYIPVCPLLIKL